MMCFCLFWCDLEQSQLCRWQGSVLHNWKPVPQIAVKYRPWRRVVSRRLKASCVKLAFWVCWVGRLLVVCLYRTPWRVQTERLDHAGQLSQSLCSFKLCRNAPLVGKAINRLHWTISGLWSSASKTIHRCPHYTHISNGLDFPMVCLCGFVWF